MQIKGYIEPKGIPIFFEHTYMHGLPVPGDELYRHGERYSVKSRCFDYSDERNPVITFRLEEI